MSPQVRVATMVDWAFAPQWLPFDQACFLSGYDPFTMTEIIEEGGVDLDDAERIERGSLWDFWEAERLVLHWDD